MSDLIKKLSEIQRKLKAPKGQYNSFAKFNYRSCEDILEAVKPLLGELVLTIDDEVIAVGGRVYIKATAALSGDGSTAILSSAVAREAETKKGMDEAQITGSASSYARKYALNGLFCIDDNKDPDVEPVTDDRFDNLKLHQEKVRDHFTSVYAVKQALCDEAVEEAIQAWFEIPKEDRRILIGIAPRNGGIFTTAEGKVIANSNEFRAYQQELVKNGDEKPDTPEE